MALRRPVVKALGCQNCQRWILRSFVAGISGYNTVQLPPNVHRQRFLSKTTARLNGVRSKIQEDEHALNDINDENSQPSEAPPPEPAQEAESRDTTYIPWYLRDSQPINQETSPLTTHETIPQLPLNPPPLLQPLLTHLSTHLGLNDLALLDLRPLDPAPALGANLLMILSTARSEKHLHVSADKLCRWLRSECGLKPYADGLLGRNELKLKVRRKAKRARLLSAVGVKDGDGVGEEGIRTGWVCVNIGRVEGGEVEVEVGGAVEGEREEGFVGFGARKGGASVVVQMLTEEKRGEVDLERLWGDMLARAERERGKADVQEESSGGISEEGSAVSEVEQGAASSQLQPGYSETTTHSPVLHVSHQNTAQQLRTYHTSVRRRMATVATATASEPFDPDPTPNPTTTPTSPLDPSTTKLTTHLQTLKSLPRSRALAFLGPDLLQTTNYFSRNHTLPPPALPSQAAAQEGGTGTIPFLHTFYASMPPFPSPQHWHAHIDLLAHARTLGHSAVHSPLLTRQIRHMLIAGLVPEERTFLLVLRSVLAPLGGKLEVYDGGGNVPSAGKMRQIFFLLEEMEGCGYDALTPGVLELLWGVCCGGAPPPPPPASAGEEGAVGVEALVSALGAARLRRLLREGDRREFWRTWRSYPQRFLPRPAGMYGVLLEAVALGELKGGVGEVNGVVMTALEEMEREVPAVRVEQDPGLARSVARALEFLEPDLKDAGEMSSGGSGSRWRSWYDRVRRID